MKELFKFQVEKYLTIFFDDKIDIHGRIFRDFEMTTNELGCFDFHEVPAKRKKLEFIKNGDTSESNSDYVENYGNPLTTVRKDYLMIVVESSDDKVSLKIFDGSRVRGVGKSHFRIRKNVMYLTINKNTGDVYNGYLKNFNLKHKSIKLIQKNNFYFNHSHAIVHKIKSSIGYGNQLNEKIMEAINIFVGEFSKVEPDEKYVLSQKLLEFYLKKKNIKYPNNYKLFWTDYEHKISLPFIRKNGNKLIDAFMKKNELKGASIKKALHEATQINMPILNMALFMFPNDWVYQDEKFINKCLHFSEKGNIFYGGNLGSNIDELNMSDVEKKRVFNIFQEVLSHKIQLYTFFDHIRFYRELKILGEEIKWMSKDKETFQEEHIVFSDKLDYYKKGHYERIYPDYMYKMLEEKIIINNEVYYPVLLNNSTSYNHESLSQSNCVKNYIGTCGSIIISLRRKDVNSEDRSTIEFRINNKPNENISFTVPQALGRFNSRLTEDWEQPVELLKKRFFKCIKDNRFQTVKLKKIFKNGKELSSNSNWDLYGNLIWESVDITNYYTTNYY